MAGTGRNASGAIFPNPPGQSSSSAQPQKAKETEGPIVSDSPFALLNQSKVELFDTVSATLPPVSSKPKFEPKIKPRGPQAKAKGSKVTPSSKSIDTDPSPHLNAVKSEPLKSPKKDFPAQSTAAQNAETPKENLDRMPLCKTVKTEPGNEVKAEADGIPSRHEGAYVVKSEGSSLPKTEHTSLDGDFVVKSEAPSLPRTEHTSLDGDHVVREIDVFLSRSVSKDKQLYLLQYPLRPSWRSYGLEEQCQQVRVKPKPKRLEVDLAIDTDCENYDQDASENIKIKTQTLSSTKAPLTKSYAIGVLKGNQLHLNPLHAIVQLRPSMKYLDAIDAQKKKLATSLAADGDEEMVGADAAEDGTRELVALQVNVRRRETEWQEESRLQSHAYLKQLDDMEPWIVLEPHGIDSPESSGLRSKMIAEARSQILFKMRPDDYINKLVPSQGDTASNEVVTGDSGGSAGFSRSFLDTLPLEKRFHLLLSKGRVHVLQFERLMKLAPDGCGEQEVLNVLKEKAVLVQGCWVVASTLRYSKPITIIRDYLLLLFTKGRVVQHSQLEDLRIPREVLREILIFFAIQRGATASWEFQESTDRSFIKRHQAVVKEQSQKWMESETYLREAVHSLQLTGMRGEGAPKIDLSTIKEVPTKATIQPSQTNKPQASDKAKEVHFSLPVDGTRDGGPNSPNAQLSGQSALPEATLAALLRALNKIFLKHNVCRLQFICQTLRQMAIVAVGGSSKDPARNAAAEEAKAAARAAAAPLPVLEAAVRTVASSIDGVYFLSTLGNPSLDPFRNVVLALLRAKGPGSGLRKTDIMEASKIALKTEVPQATYQKVLKELCYTKGGAWVLKPGDGRPN